MPQSYFFHGHCFIFASLARVNERVHVHNERILNQAELDSVINVPSFLNEHGDLYFLSHNNSVRIILFNLQKSKKILPDREKDVGESEQKTVLWNGNYDRENNDYRNALRPCLFKWWDFLQISYDIVPYTRHFCQVFPKY